MYLLPRPKHWIGQDGVYLLSYDRWVILDESCTPDVFAYAKQLNACINEYCGYDLPVTRGECGQEGIHFHIDPVDAYAHADIYESTKLQSYRIRIDREGIRINGASETGLFYGIQTFRQILMQSGPVIPYMEIEDEPALPHRGFLHDVTRGRIPTLSWLKTLADKLALYKVNQLHLYVEHSFLFHDLSEVWRDDTPLTPGEILELDAYCRERRIDLVPCMASFGHLYKVLRTRSFAHLGEFPEMAGEKFGFADRMLHHTLDVSNPESLPFAKRLIDEYLPLFSSRYFNICADETFDLGKGRSRRLAEERGEHRLYIDYVRELCEHVKARGRVPMFWGDIICQFPDAIGELPDDTICLNWGYEPDVSEESTRKLHAAGAHLYQCPGVNGWNEFVPKIADSYQNISRMCSYAVKYRAEGLLNTDWGDYGHINHPDFSVTALIYGAALSWNPGSDDYQGLNQAISRLEYGDPEEKLAFILADIADAQIYGWRELADYMDAQKGDPGKRMRQSDGPSALRSVETRELEQSLEKLDQITAQLYQLLAGIQPGKRAVLRPCLNAIDGVRLLQMTGFYISARENGKSLDKSEALPEPSRLASMWERWLLHYKEEWRRISRESELFRIQDLICCCADLLREMPADTEGESDDTEA